MTTSFFVRPFSHGRVEQNGRAKHQSYPVCYGGVSDEQIYSSMLLGTREIFLFGECQ